MAIEPINYLGMVPQQDFLRDIQGGLQLGVGLRQAQQQAAQQERDVQMAQQYKTDIAAAMTNPSPRVFAALAAKYPAQREALKQSWEQLDAAERKSQGEAALQASFALESGNTEAAKGVLQNRIAALENSGMDASQEKLILGAIDTHPKAVRGHLLQWAAFTQDPQKLAENYGKIGGELRAGDLHTDAVREAGAKAAGAEADAQTKAVTAKYADSQALADLEKKRWDVKKIVADIDFQRESNRIAAISAAANREGNSLKREELKLKLEEARTARDDKLREKVAKAESAATSMDNMLNTVERLLKNPALNDVVGAIEGRDFYPNTLAAAATTPTPYGLFSSSGDDRADAIALVDNLGSQAFLSQVPTVQGMGALSNAEGEKLQSALQNLSRKQSETQFRENLREVQRLVRKGRDNVSKRYGVPLGAPDTPASPAERPPLSSFYR